MKHLIIMWFGVVLLVSSGKNALSETWRIASLVWPPYAGPMLDEDGIAVAVLRSSLARINVELEIDYMAWPRAKALTAQNDYLAFFPAWPEEILEGYISSKPVEMSQIGVVFTAGQPVRWNSLQEVFDKYTVGFVSNYVYPEALQAEIDQRFAGDAGADTERDLVRMLAAGRVDVAITDPNVMLFLAEEMALGSIRAHSKVLFRKPLLVAFKDTPENRVRRDQLNKVLPTVNLHQLVCCRFVPQSVEMRPVQ
ncbi:transporter substrate-binding domain-containing protein [Roseibium denhamense]|uniref:Polar amino acid transport system substrate-binding protein n=1 Tax=Roseibium denhamense TaxID=76305 RepID=A0ABY1NQL3_9HYPH|nr:transporter substrate-binding domain-containing protein [Roseibium denhamense]MTI07873.1 transporter substrate-binding domain-containing protein [Roseibium denhamense]SMP14559.1 polar amino acid transport system substrate-binding protein [Roseibium denhamense]